MYIKRDIEKKLLDWKIRSSCALEIEGSRQVGKTTTIEKFVKDNFKHVIYINLDEISGEHFISLIEYCKQSSVFEEFYLNLIKTFAEQENLIFSNDENTVIVIDEIQKNKEIYEMIRPLNRYLNCRLIVTGSYLGKAKQFFQPAGDTEKLTMYPINFLEFIAIWGGRTFLENQNLLSWDSSHDDWFQNAYLNYSMLGGYPEVVAAAVQNNFSLDAVTPVKDKIFRLVSDELKSQFINIEDKVMSGKFFKYVISYLIREKTGKSLVKGLTDFISGESGTFSLREKEVKRYISWLLECGILDLCDVHDFVTNYDDTGARVYFRDMGVLYDVLKNSRFPIKDQQGFISENFVFKTLNENFDSVPQFGLYNQGELDFVFLKGGIFYGIEVKHGKNSGKTAMNLLKNKKIQKLLYFKGNTGAGVKEDIITLPIWAAAVCKYDFVKPNEMPVTLKLMDAFKL